MAGNGQFGRLALTPRGRVRDTLAGAAGVTAPPNLACGEKAGTEICASFPSVLAGSSPTAAALLPCFTAAMAIRSYMPAYP